MLAKQRILTCALDELQRSGVEGFSLRAVGVAAGITPMAVYRHYRNREDLLAAAGEEAFGVWKARIGAIKAAHPLDWLRLASRSYAEFALDEPALFDACFVLRTSVERLYPADFIAGKSPVIALVVKRIEEAQAQGQLARGDALEAAMSLWAQLHGLVMLHRSGRFAMKREDYLGLCARCIERVTCRPRGAPMTWRASPWFGAVAALLAGALFLVSLDIGPLGPLALIAPVAVLVYALSAPRWQSVAAAAFLARIIGALGLVWAYHDVLPHIALALWILGHAVGFALIILATRWIARGAPAGPRSFRSRFLRRPANFCSASSRRMAVLARSAMRSWMCCRCCSSRASAGLRRWRFARGCSR